MSGPCPGAVVTAQPLAILRYQAVTAGLIPTPIIKRCHVCEAFKQQRGGKFLSSPSARMKRWACGDCVTAGAV